ncbi:hypothetical protein ATANTOWER_018832, partial [Ataeniobius toweri]|nr:hypothetical protein [Ataeniobius toweri]
YGNQFPSSHSVIGFQCSASTRSVHQTTYLKTPSVNLLTTSLDAPLAASLVHRVRTIPQPSTHLPVHPPDDALPLTSNKEIITSTTHHHLAISTSVLTFLPWNSTISPSCHPGFLL